MTKATTRRLKRKARRERAKGLASATIRPNPVNRHYMRGYEDGVAAAMTAATEQIRSSKTITDVRKRFNIEAPAKL